MQPATHLSIESMCGLGQVSRAGFYRHWQQQEPGVEETELRAQVQQIALAHRRNYGYRRVTQELRQQGWAVNRKRVARIMAADNLLCVRRRRFVLTTDSTHDLRVHLNLAGRMQLSGIDQLWVADLTYIRLREQFVFLAVILDAFSRRCVGSHLSEEIDSKLTLAALEKAIEVRRPPARLIHHSDRGVQYACGDYIARLEAAGILPSMSRAGCPYGNAMAESFMKTLKHEQVNGTAYRDLAHARAEIGSFIEQVYNRQRLHSALAYLSPDEYEEKAPRAAAQQPLAATANSCP